MKYVNMTEALRQVREKAPNTADAMARHKAGNAGFTDKAHLKAKGLIPRSDGTKKVSPKYEETCPKCEGEACQCPQSETLEITNADKTDLILLHIKITSQVMNTIILQKI